MNKTSILVADDHEVVRAGLAAVLGFQKDFTICGQAENGETAVAMSRELLPDVVVMDLMMPRKDGVEATREILKASPSSRIVVLTTYASSFELRRVLAAGAKGALSKDRPNSELISAIRTVAAGGSFISPDITAQLEDKPISELSDRQLEILAALSRGLSNRDIAIMLDITEDGVKAHMKTIFSKLDVANRLEAASYAITHQLI